MRTAEHSEEKTYKEQGYEVYRETESEIEKLASEPELQKQIDLGERPLIRLNTMTALDTFFTMKKLVEHFEPEMREIAALALKNGREEFMGKFTTEGVKTEEFDGCCQNCGVQMMLEDGTEWPDDGHPILCWNCMREAYITRPTLVATVPVIFNQITERAWVRLFHADMPECPQPGSVVDYDGILYRVVDQPAPLWVFKLKKMQWIVNVSLRKIGDAE